MTKIKQRWLWVRETLCYCAEVERGGSLESCKLLAYRSLNKQNTLKTLQYPPDLLQYLLNWCNAFFRVWFFFFLYILLYFQYHVRMWRVFTECTFAYVPLFLLTCGCSASLEPPNKCASNKCYLTPSCLCRLPFLFVCMLPTHILYVHFVRVHMFWDLQKPGFV